MMTTNFARDRNLGFLHSKSLQHTNHDWKFNNLFQYNLADSDCSRSEAVVAESERLCQATRQETEKLKSKVERKFDQRISDVDYWWKEGNKIIAKLQDVLDKLAHLKLRVKQAVESCKNPISACRMAMAEREKRLGADMVQDQPQVEIQRYHLYLEEVLNVLEKTLQELEDQMINDRAAKRRLSRDVADKQTALEIDTHAVSCRPENSVSKEFRFDPNLLCSEKSQSTTAEWERTTRHSLEKAEQEVKNSRNFIPRVEEILGKTYLELTKQRLNVLSALNERIKDTSSAQKNLEERLGRVQKQILDVEDTLAKLDHSMERKLPSLRLASKRMEDRCRRPRLELCHDEVDAGLEEEVRQLSFSLHQLRDQGAQSREMLRKLEQTRLSLQKEVDVKKNTLRIDQEHCVTAFSNVVHIRH